jgi:exosortase/archaeosortase family protein
MKIYNDLKISLLYYLGKRKINPFIFSFAILLTLYIVIRLLTFKSYPIFPVLSFLANSYLLFIESISNYVLHWAGSIVTIENHDVIVNNTLLDGFVPEIRFKKWMGLYLFLIWITNTSVRKRVNFSIFIILVHFLILAIYNAFGAHFLGLEKYDKAVLSIPVTISLLIMNTFLFFWYTRNKSAFLKSLSWLKINTKLLENNLYVIIVIYVCIITFSFLIEYFDFVPWINFLFTSAQKILALFGYEASVEPNYLIGANGSISMAKECLGFQTMFLFAIIVFLTGDKNRYRWIYICSGLVFLNFVNIMRFVLLFIHLQNNEGYKLTMELHDMYNYVTYSVVFVLWVIWFEMFNSSKSKK